MKRYLRAGAIAAAARLAGAAACLLAAAAPAAAGQARAILTVTATVAPACSVDRRPAARYGADIACSTGANVSTRTAARHDERPLEEAATILGAPVRSSAGIAFTAPARAASSEPADPGATRYLTISY